MSAPLLNIFHDAINTFSDIVAEHAQTDQFYMRCWQTFAPAGAQGRAPNIHIDKTDLTGLWYAGRAPAQIYTGDIQEDIWTALADNTNDSAQILTEFTQKIDPKDLLDMPTGTLNIVINKKDKDLEDPLVRNKVCPHMSSNKISERGQAGLILVPKFLGS